MLDPSRRGSTQASSILSEIAIPRSATIDIPTPPRLKRRHLPTLSLFFVPLVALLLLAPATVGGSTTSIVEKAPFKGTVQGIKLVNVNGCSSASDKKAGSFSLKSGKGGMSGQASWKPCPSPTGGISFTGSGLAQGGFQIALPLNITSSGNYNISATWSFKWSGSLDVIGGGRCKTSTSSNSIYSNLTQGQCYSAAYVSTWLQSFYLFDATNGSDICPLAQFYCVSYGYQEWGLTNSSLNETDIYYGCWNASYSSAPCFSYNSTYNASTSQNVSGASSSTFWMNGTLNGRHRYFLVATWYGEADAYGAGWTNTARSSASFNMRTLGNGVTLKAIVIK